MTGTAPLRVVALDSQPTMHALSRIVTDAMFAVDVPNWSGHDEARFRRAARELAGTVARLYADLTSELQEDCILAALCSARQYWLKDYFRSDNTLRRHLESRAGRRAMRHIKERRQVLLGLDEDARGSDGEEAKVIPFAGRASIDATEPYGNLYRRPVEATVEDRMLWVELAKRMSPEVTLVIHLHYLAGWTYREISQTFPEQYPSKDAAFRIGQLANSRRRELLHAFLTEWDRA